MTGPPNTAAAPQQGATTSHLRTEVQQPTTEAGWWTSTKEITDFAGDALTVVASLIAIWIFVSKGREIRAFANALSSFVHQNSLAELRTKLEQLGNLNATEESHRHEIVSIFHDICGQIDGNPHLKSKIGDLCNRIREKTGPKRRPITEPEKRSFVSELRESLRHFDASDYAAAMGEYKK